MMKKHTFTLQLKTTFFVSLLLFLLSSTANAKVVAVCNSDFLICGTIDSETIETGILPLGLQKKGLQENEIEYINFGDAFLNNKDFDVALLPTDLAAHWQNNEKYFYYHLPLKNTLVQLIPKTSNVNNRNIAPKSICQEDMVNIDCAPTKKLIKKFLDGHSNIIAYKSQIERLMPSLTKDAKEVNLQDISYALLINKKSPLVNLNLNENLISNDGFGYYQFITFLLLIVLLCAGCFAAFIHVTSKIDEQSGCFSKKEFEKKIKTHATTAITVMLLDYNNFKKVNDTKGHQIGDMVIEQVSAELIKILREGDKIYRIGGDEFFLSFSNKLPTSRETQVTKQIENIGKIVSKRLDLEEIHFGISVGKLEVGKGDSLKEAYKEVDRKMYEQKLISKVGR